MDPIKEIIQYVVSQVDKGDWPHLAPWPDSRRIGVLVARVFAAHVEFGWSLCNLSKGDMFNRHMGLTVARSRALFAILWPDSHRNYVALSLESVYRKFVEKTSARYPDHHLLYAKFIKYSRTWNVDEPRCPGFAVMDLGTSCNMGEVEAHLADA